MKKLLLFVLCLLQSCQLYHYKRLKLPEHQDKKFNLKSVVLTGYGRYSYSQESVEQYIEYLQDINANSASLLITCFTDNSSSSNVFCSEYDTPTISEIEYASQKIQNAGLLLNLRIYIDLQSKEWRCHWNPKDKEKAFMALENVLFKYVTLAEKVKAESIIIGAEYCHLTEPKYTKYWTGLIEKIRTVYKGKISYGANWNIPYKSKFSSEYEQIQFWDSLDWIGIDYYWPLNKRYSPTTKNLHFHHQNNLVLIEDFAQKKKKNVLITEVGFPIEDGGSYNPFDWTLKGPINPEEHFENHKAFLEEYKKRNNIYGAFFWHLNPRRMFRQKGIVPNKKALKQSWSDNENTNNN